MLKVAWPVPNTPAWIGGLHYFLNLTSALLALPDRRLEPVVLGGAAGLPEPLGSLAAVPRAGDFAKYSRRWFLLKLGRHFGLQDHRQIRLFQDHGVRLFSHGWPLGPKSPLPSLCWIPDFQHKRLPEMFSLAEITARNMQFAQVAQNAQAALLSSRDAENDFRHYFPQAAARTHVLSFVASPPRGGDPGEEAGRLAQLGIEEPYFHLPNQLWRHKNHGLALEALVRLAADGRRPLVVSTGQMSDYRHPNYFSDLRRKVEAAGLSERFRFLGLLDFSQAAAIMRGAVALINPSRFEGWSTTVEEAKSLGKRLLLSDIPVHREQNPEHGWYFGVDDAEALAGLMRQALESFSPAEEKRRRAAAEAALPGRVASFARNYEAIAFQVAGETA